MNYNIDLPEELRAVSIPKFVVTDNKLVILNKPTWWDLIFPVGALVVIFLMFISGNISFKGPYDEDYLLLLIGLLTLGTILLFSLNRISIDFEQRLVLIKNYNPLVNLGRKFFKLPFSISFNEVEKIYSDWKLGGRGSRSKYFTVLETDAPYKFTIAIFERENQSIIFTDYLKQVIKHHRIHTAQVSDTTVMP